MKAFLFCCLIAFGVHFCQAQSTAKALLLFGGNDHKTFLGCLNCVDTSTASICNEYGKYGSEYNETSIWDEYGKFGSSYSNESPWNSFSNEPPIIVDKDGKSYGYFSTNEYIHDRTTIDWIVKVLDFQDSKDDLEKTRKLLCDD